MFSKIKQLWSSKSADKFQMVEGYSEIKDIIIRALDSEESQNILLCGPPASSKTLFLMAIQEMEPEAIFFDAANTTNRILDVLEEKRPRIILIDEIDKAPKTLMGQLLNFMSSGRIKVDKQKKSYDFVITGAKVITTANDLQRLTKPLQSRFLKLHLSRYTEEQFVKVTQKVLPKLSIDLSTYIGRLIFSQGGDIRQVLATGKLIRKDDGPEEVDQIVQTITKYGKEVVET